MVTSMFLTPTQYKEDIHEKYQFHNVHLYLMALKIYYGINSSFKYIIS
jgi:hypothetical protein